jgi:hypothetical protein
MNLNNSKGDLPMKSTLIRALAVLTLTTWMSVFAAVNNSENEAAKGNAGQTETKKTETQKTKKHQDKAKKSPKESQEDKEYDRALLGIHG